MFKNVMKFAFLFMIGAVIFSSGCKKDPVVEPEPEQDPPTVSLVDFQDATLADTVSLVSPTATQIVYIKAAKGTGNMKTLKVYAGDTLIAYTDDNYKLNQLPLTANPILIVADTTAFTWEFWINPPDAVGVYAYTFMIEDVNGKTAEASIAYKVTEPVIVSDLELTGESTFQFWNNLGANPGGLDVRDGSAQSTVSGTPHIKDNGGSAWKKTISAIGGTSGFAVGLKATTGVDFDAIQLKDEIATLYDDDTNPLITGESAVIANGDIFVVRVITGVANQVTTYSLVKFINVHETAADNDDYYQVNIKK